MNIDNKNKLTQSRESLELIQGLGSTMMNGQVELGEVVRCFDGQ